jgi:hypothetical protein
VQCLLLYGLCSNCGIEGGMKQRKNRVAYGNRKIHMHVESCLQRLLLNNVGFLFKIFLPISVIPAAGRPKFYNNFSRKHGLKSTLSNKPPPDQCYSRRPPFFSAKKYNWFISVYSVSFYYLFPFIPLQCLIHFLFFLFIFLLISFYSISFSY